MKKCICVFLMGCLLLGVGAMAESGITQEQRELWLSRDQYYYGQLSEEHKAAWETDVYNALNYPNQILAEQPSARYQALASMIVTDNPRIFWINWIDTEGFLRYDTTESTREFMILPDGKSLKDMQQIFLDAIDSAVKEIKGTLPAKAGNREKAKAVHDWICKNNSYNDEQTSKYKKNSNPVAFAYQAAHSAYSAIVKGDMYQPVCEGYAGAFKVLCDELGVPCLCVNGSTSFASGHMWNLVQLEDGKWYLVDATSDDVEKSGVEYVHQLFLIGQKKSAGFAYTPKAYMNSGVNPSNGYTEGAAFTVPEMAP